MKLLVFDFFFGNSELVPIVIQTLGLSPLYPSDNRFFRKWDIMNSWSKLSRLVWAASPTLVAGQNVLYNQRILLNAFLSSFSWKIEVPTQWTPLIISSSWFSDPPPGSTPRKLLRPMTIGVQRPTVSKPLGFRHKGSFSTRKFTPLRHPHIKVWWL